MGLVTQILPLMGWVVLVVCGLVCAWALFWDRPRGRARCRRCRYRMEGVPAQPGGSVICPECGRKHASVGKLHHTHRRWRVAVSCLLIGLVGWYVLSFHWRFRERGWMGYVPTTVIVLLPESADAWFDGCDGPRPTTPIYEELRYRTHTIGMRLWQERLWVWNLRREAEARRDGDWAWRFVRKADLTGRRWSRHHCSIGCTMFQQRRCPGDGAFRLELISNLYDGWRSFDVDWAIELVNWLDINKYISTPDYRSGIADSVASDVLLACYTREWPTDSAYEAYYMNDRTDILIHDALNVMHARPNWSPVEGWTDAPDRFCSVSGMYGRLRLFDLYPFYAVANIASEQSAHDETQMSFIRWLLERAGYDFFGGGGGTVENPALSFPHRDRLYLASTPQGLEEAAAKLQALYEQVEADPDCWRRAKEDETSP